MSAPYLDPSSDRTPRPGTDETLDNGHWSCREPGRARTQSPGPSRFLPASRAPSWSPEAQRPGDMRPPSVCPGSLWVPGATASCTQRPLTFTAGSIGSHPEARPTVGEAVVGSKQVHAALALWAEVGIPRALIHIWGQARQGCRSTRPPSRPPSHRPGPAHPHGRPPRPRSPWHEGSRPLPPLSITP